MQAGTVVADRFEIIELAGSGGMGSVYRARDMATGDVVALKLLSHHSAHAPRFRREAELLAALEHPSVVRYIAHGAPTDVAPAYIAMEWLEGESLRDRLAGGSLPVAEAVSVARQAALALGVAHDRGIVHRDVKPENLFLIRGDVTRLKLLDFGVALARDAKQRMTHTGVQMGTIGYMAPEQVRGETDIDARADVFALGEVLFECLTGLPAFSANHPLAVLAKIVFDDAPRVRELRPAVPFALDELCSRMLEKDRELRPKNGGAVARALEAFDSVAASDEPAPVRRSVGITSSERHVVSAIVGRSKDELPDDTMLQSDHDARSGELRAVVESLGGRFESLAAPSFVAVFAGSSAATDTASRAARAALRLADCAPELDLALVTGSAVVGDRLPVAKVVDGAVELFAAGAGRGVCLDDTTLGLLPARFSHENRGGASWLVAEREPAHPGRLLLGRPVPCIGRERELTTLEAIVDEVLDESVARAVLLTGPPGVGKSRVRFELVRSLAAREPPVRTWIGRGDALTAGAPFGLIANALRGALGLVDAEAELMQKKLDLAVARIPGSERERARVFLGELLGVPSGQKASVELRAAREDPVLMRDQTRRAFEALLAAECAQGGLAIVLEDLQWGDLPSVELVDGALRNLSEHALLVLGVGRAEVFDVFPRLWSERSVLELRLRELSKKAAGEIARRALDESVPAATLEALVERAAGNAFHLEELIRAHAEGRGDAPDSVLAMVRSRLEGMEPDVRRILRAASVFGQTAWRDGIAFLLGDLEPQALAGWLSVLAEREVLTRRSESRYAHDHEYVFRHSLVRDAAYDMLTESDRALAHRMAAQWLTTRGERDARLLAEHLEKGGAPEAAGPWWTRAALGAFDANDMGEALACVARGKSTGLAGVQLGELALVEAEALRWSGRVDDARVALDTALRELERGSGEWYRAVAELTLVLQRLGKSDELGPLGSLLLAQATIEKPTHALMYALVRSALFTLLAGESLLAHELVAAVDRAEQTGTALEPSTRAQRHVFRAVDALYRSDLGTYLRAEVAAKAEFERIGDLRRALNESGSIGYAYVELGAYEDAERALDEARANADKLGIVHVRAAALHNLGLVYANLGRFEEATRSEQAAAEIFRQHQDRRLEGAAITYLAEIALLAGDHGRAEAVAREALVLVEEAAPPIVPLALGILSRARLAGGDSAQALEFAERAMLSVRAPGGVESGEALIRLAHAEALLAAGRNDEARAALEESAARLRARGDLIDDAVLRKSFLERVPENRRTLELASKPA